MKKQTNLIHFPVAFFAAALLFSCSGTGTEELKQPEIVMEIPSSGFEVEVGKQIMLQPNYINAEKATVSWEIDGNVVSTTKSLVFLPQKVGKYAGHLKLNSENGSDLKSFTINATSQNSPYIKTVFEYVYGVGQHASLIPANEKATAFIGEPWKDGKSFTYLGGWGGYIVAGFDHAVANTEGADFAIYTQPGAASEPGVVYVMQDKNADGQPNDIWYELKGSEYNNSETVKNYEVTYYNPGGKGNIKWSDNKGGSGLLVSGYESESWWWSGYGNKNSVTFSGTKLPNVYQNISTDAAVERWSIRNNLFKFGYAECYNNDDYNSQLKANLFDIGNAIDSNGNPVNLTNINFIKVQSGVFQVAGWLNEISTEISGAADLHLLDKDSY